MTHVEKSPVRRTVGREPCHKCGGDGIKIPRAGSQAADREQCPKCRGKGWRPIYRVELSADGVKLFERGRRRGFLLPYDRAFLTAVRLVVDRDRAEKQAKRRSSRRRSSRLR